MHFESTMMRTFSALLLLVAACGGSDSTGTTNGTSSDPNAPAAENKSSGPAASSTDEAPKCGNTPCAASEYCELSYDSKAEAWSPSRCVAYPAKCSAPQSAFDSSDACDCIDKASHVCPTSGTALSSCQAVNGALGFGCTSL